VNLTQQAEEQAVVEEAMHQKVKAWAEESPKAEAPSAADVLLEVFKRSPSLAARQLGTPRTSSSGRLRTGLALTPAHSGGGESEKEGSGQEAPELENVLSISEPPRATSPTKHFRPFVLALNATMMGVWGGGGGGHPVYIMCCCCP
jgi:hypothetical protein